MTERDKLFSQREVAVILGIPWDELPKHTAYFINATRRKSKGELWQTGYSGKDIVLMFLGLRLQEYGLAPRNARGMARVVSEWWEWYYDEGRNMEEEGEDECFLVSELLPGGTITSHTMTLGDLTAQLLGRQATSLADQPLLVINLEDFVSSAWRKIADALDDLAQNQGVEPMDDVSRLHGTWPGDPEEEKTMNRLRWHFENRRWWTDDGLGFEIEQNPNDGVYYVRVKDPSGYWPTIASAKNLNHAKRRAEERQAIEDREERDGWDLPPDPDEELYLWKQEEEIRQGVGPLLWPWTNQSLEPQMACCRRCLWWQAHSSFTAGSCAYDVPRGPNFPEAWGHEWCRKFEPGDIAPTY